MGSSRSLIQFSQPRQGKGSSGAFEVRTGGARGTQDPHLGKESVFVLKIGAADGIRTHDPHLGKVMLYP